MEPGTFMHKPKFMGLHRGLHVYSRGIFLVKNCPGGELSEPGFLRIVEASKLNYFQAELDHLI